MYFCMHAEAHRCKYSLFQGTLIRVFDIVKKYQIVELRRGADPATLYWWVLSVGPSTFILLVYTA